MSGYELMASMGFLGFAAFVIVVIVFLKIYGDFKRIVINEEFQSAFKASAATEDRSKS